VNVWGIVESEEANAIPSKSLSSSHPFVFQVWNVMANKKLVLESVLDSDMYDGREDGTSKLIEMLFKDEAAVGSADGK